MGLQRLEQEIGLSLPTFIEEFADSVAFAQAFPGAKSGVTVSPVSSVTVQDARSLLTQVTVTALVRTANFDCLRIGLDPQCWTSCSDAFRHTGYVADATDRAPLDPIPEPGYFDWVGPPPKLVEERVVIAWGTGESEASFHNILNINRLTIDEKTGAIDIEFDLNRSISSRILWDERAGGILVDEGYARARKLDDNLWRLTVRKIIRFSDRTPYVGGSGWNDFGQVLNYLAPGTLSWWIERELYSAACQDTLKLARERGKSRSTREEHPDGA
jgi:hypothetical protein